MSARSLGTLLRKKMLTVAVAESCTGGKIGDMITDVSGSSDYFLGGVISYSNEAKASVLGVDKSILRSKGAVSEEVASQMAAGVRRRLGADLGVSTTGIAGPKGGTSSKPVGLVYIAVSSSKGQVVSRNVFRGSRDEVKTKSAIKALRMAEDFVAARY